MTGPTVERPLAGRVVLVSGVGPGLGRHIALNAARAGADVVVGARTESTLRTLVEEIEALGARAVFERCDITSTGDCRRLAAAAEHHFGGLDAVVANGFHKGTFGVPIADIDFDAWRDTFEVNFYGSLRLVQATIPALRRRGRGSIVMIGSQVILRLPANRADYAASKAALETASRVLARELGPENIRVNTVHPGFMWGPTVIEHQARTAAETGTTPEALRQRLLEQMALPRIATDEEVARVAVFFATDGSAGMTGQSVHVNAGQTFH